MKSKAKTITITALLIAAAFVFSYLESLIPINFGIPGIKLGLANLVVLTSLYLLDEKKAFAISVIRIILSGLTFNGLFSMVYSLVGGLLSFCIMLILKKGNKLSIIGISAASGVAHNFGQIIAAAVVMRTYRIIYYFPVLMISGLITGIVIGILSSIIVQRIKKHSLNFK